MDNGMWALGLLLFPLIGCAISIFLVIKFMRFIANKTQEKQLNNITIDYNIQKEDKINLKEKTKLYKIFIIFSILICVFLLPFINSMTSKFPSAYSGNEASTGVITPKIANQIAVYVWPILIVYLIMILMLITRKTNYRKVYYPLSLFTLTIILFNIGIIYSGYMILWYLIYLFYPLTAFLVILSIIGNKLDNNTLTKKTVGIILRYALLITLVIPILTLVPSFIQNKVEEARYDDKIVKVEIEQNNKYEKMEKKIKEEFNNLLVSNFISINDFKLSTDYSKVNDIELLITNDNIPNDEIDFCNELIESYNNIKVLLYKYNYTSPTIHFKFTNRNPFTKETSTFYKEGGYIRDDKTLYFIYLNPTPVIISK